MEDAAHRPDGDRLLGVEGGDSGGDLGVGTREGSLVVDGQTAHGADHFPGPGGGVTTLTDWDSRMGPAGWAPARINGN